MPTLRLNKHLTVHHYKIQIITTSNILAARPPGLKLLFSKDPTKSASSASLQSASNSLGVTTTLSPQHRQVRKEYNELRREFQALIRKYTDLTVRCDEVMEACASSSVRMSAESRGGESFISTGGNSSLLANRSLEDLDDAAQGPPPKVQVKTYATDPTAAVVQSRAADIEVIARNVRDVNEVYRDLANLVDEQQVEIDDIEQNIMMTRERTEKGAVHLRKATDFQKKSGRCVKVMVAIVIVAAVVCIGVLYGDRIIHGTK
ncbi:hypothetical protein TrRE_jg5207 [Triparma retinervis]|uniref:t-SNARE coiled-coil homology domain-containing protein n=1 Tax=Triparma retinervis TaxID=2557542 RepID=A0A9W6ZLW3_9STRA|nr:hypothetical protein TrRE_jg5207 [Triparma retinervis]